MAQLTSTQAVSPVSSLGIIGFTRAKGSPRAEARGRSIKGLNGALDGGGRADGPLARPSRAVARYAGSGIKGGGSAGQRQAERGEEGPCGALAGAGAAGGGLRSGRPAGG